MDRQVRQYIWSEYELPREASIESFGKGLINATYLVTCSDGSNTSDKAPVLFILQIVNSYVFKNPLVIDRNLLRLGTHLSKFNPTYKLPLPLPTKTGATTVLLNGTVYRLFEFVKNSRTYDIVDSVKLAFNAAAQFAKFTKAFADMDITSLEDSLPDFHNLVKRSDELRRAEINASSKRLKLGEMAIAKAKAFSHIAAEYEQLVSDAVLRRRVTHHDTKISNVLFDASDEAICVIDLDTVMPGFFISDMGDMVRTYCCTKGEEDFAEDFAYVAIREEYFAAVVDGYLSEMAPLLTAEEKEHILFAGKFIVYMQAVRFLTDYLEGDSYYGAAYEGQNLNRALNQFALLKDILKKEDRLKEIVANSLSKYG